MPPKGVCGKAMGIHPPPPPDTTDLIPCAFGTLLGARMCLLCVSWVRRWPRTGLANRPPLCLPTPLSLYPLPRASNALRPVRGVVMCPRLSSSTSCSLDWWGHGPSSLSPSAVHWGSSGRCIPTFHVVSDIGLSGLHGNAVVAAVSAQPRGGLPPQARHHTELDLGPLRHHCWLCAAPHLARRPAVGLGDDRRQPRLIHDRLSAACQAEREYELGTSADARQAGAGMPRLRYYLHFHRADASAFGFYSRACGDRIVQLHDATGAGDARLSNVHQAGLHGRGDRNARPASNIRHWHGRGDADFLWQRHRNTVRACGQLGSAAAAGRGGDSQHDPPRRFSPEPRHQGLVRRGQRAAEWTAAHARAGGTCADG
eukprot:scaffold5506_cov114-Isochrysis_galbana.AAC.5